MQEFDEFGALRLCSVLALSIHKAAVQHGVGSFLSNITHRMCHRCVFASIRPDCRGGAVHDDDLWCILADGAEHEVPRVQAAVRSLFHPSKTYFHTSCHFVDAERNAFTSMNCSDVMPRALKESNLSLSFSHWAVSETPPKLGKSSAHSMSISSSTT